MNTQCMEFKHLTKGKTHKHGELQFVWAHILTCRMNSKRLVENQAEDTYYLLENKDVNEKEMYNALSNPAKCLYSHLNRGSANLTLEPECYNCDVINFKMSKSPNKHRE